MEQTIADLKEFRELQKSKGFTDETMAGLIGVSRPYFNLVVNGKRPLSEGFLSRFILSLLLRETTQAATKREPRQAEVKRETTETKIDLELNLDGSGQYQVDTGITMFDHMLAQVARHGRFDIKLSATGDDPHHLVEDVALCLGRALGRALGEKRGIVRMSVATVPMDDALAMVAVDISGRAYTVLELAFSENDMAGFSTDLIRHFLESFAVEARLNLHARIIYGVNDHHRAEALFKALGRALDVATRIDGRLGGELPSTKGLL